MLITNELQGGIGAASVLVHMTLDTAKQNIGGYFYLANQKCMVTTADKFGGVVHYGFVVVDTGRNNGLIGWVPADMIGGTEI